MLADAVLAFDVVGVVVEGVVEETVFLEAVAEEVGVVPLKALFAVGVPGYLLVPIVEIGDMEVLTRTICNGRACHRSLRSCADSRNTHAEGR